MEFWFSAESNERLQVHLKERMHALEEKNALTQELEKTRKIMEEQQCEKVSLLILKHEHFHSYDANPKQVIQYDNTQPIWATENKICEFTQYSPVRQSQNFFDF